MEKPLIVQSDRSVLLEVDNDAYHDARDRICRFAELEKSPEHIHFYRISPLSIWNAAAAGMSADEMVDSLREFSRYDVPKNVERDLRDYVRRYGLVTLVKEGERMLLRSDDPYILEEVRRNPGTSLTYQSMIPSTLRMNRMKLLKIYFPQKSCLGCMAGQ